jgi:D-alanyl-D-alanine carboxypeptidase
MTARAPVWHQAPKKAPEKAAKTFLAGFALAAMAVLASAGGVAAGPSLVVDAASGRVIQSEEATRPWYPASLSKLMTAYTVFKAIQAGRLNVDTPIVISARAAKAAPSKMGYPPGTMVTVDDALKMLIVHSANDIAVALAEGVAGSVEAFSGEMNGYSRALGMQQSSWVNPNGLPDPRQISSARDMALLARAIMTEFPQYDGIFGIQALQAGKRILRTHNALVYRYPGGDGMKTGFICASGFNVVATATRGGRRLITVVLGASSAKERTNIAASLFEKGFSGGGSWFGGGGATLASLSASPYTTPTDIREIACGRKKGGSSAAEQEDVAEVSPPGTGGNKDGVMATLLAQQPGAPVATRGDGPLLTSWTIAPPVPVGPYIGPKRPVGPAGVAVATAPAKPAKPGTAQAASYADTTPEQPAAGEPMLLPGSAAPGAMPPALGAIRPGDAASADRSPLPGQIRRTANPLRDLQSDPLPSGRPKKARAAKAARTAQADDDAAVPVPSRRPDGARPAASPAKKKKKKAPPQG